jgi:Family of unknown function (DUF6157)
MNYYSTFIAVAADTRATAATAPPQRGGAPTVAALEYELITSRPYELTQEEVQFAVHVQRASLAPERVEADRADLWADFFSRPMACMRSSPLPKTYGWGLHFDEDGKVALVPLGSPEYERLSSDPALEQTRAMRSRRA